MANRSFGDLVHGVPETPKITIFDVYLFQELNELE